MRHEAGRYKTFARRSILLAGAQGLLLTGLGARLYYLQVVESDRYRTLADENRISLRLVAPPRGLILDRHGAAVASNSQNYRVLVVPEQTKRSGDRLSDAVARTLDDLSRLISLDEFDRQRILREVGRKREFVPVTVAENLTWEEFSRLNVNSPDLPGVVPDVGETRHYPMGGALSHVVGYVAPVSEDDIDDDPLLQLPGFRIGRSGIERQADVSLRGKAGSSHVEVNAHGRVIREIERNEGLQGQNVFLSIDAHLQDLAAKRLEGESAGVVLIDVHTGDVLAMASTPYFEPDAFTFGMSRHDWDLLVSNPRKPLLNKAVSGQYPPGSTFKMIVALSALEDGVAHPGHRVFCNGKKKLGNRTFHCWKRGGHGELTMAKAIEQSCDVYFYDIALRAGIDRISEMALRFGLGSSEVLGLGVEQPGLVPSRAWKLARTGESWQAGETLITGIGQGFVLTTPLQLALMTAMIANGGRKVTPRLILPAREDKAEIMHAGDAELAADSRSLGISGTSMALVQEGMRRVMNIPTGTGFRSRILEPGLEMAGKTGTSQVRSISAAEREAGIVRTADRPWIERDHAVFVGYAPLNDPRYAIAVIVEHGGGGAVMAAPIARDVLLEAQQSKSAERRNQFAATGAAQGREG